MSRTLRSFLAVLLLASCSRRTARLSRPAPGQPLVTPAPPSFLDEVARETYTPVSVPAALPPAVQRAIANDLGRDRLVMAAPGMPYNFGCLIDPQLPDLRLIGAAIGPRHAVIAFEQGGFATVSHLLVIGHTTDSAVVLWSGALPHTVTDASTLRSAVAAGTIWRPENAVGIQSRPGA